MRMFKILPFIKRDLKTFASYPVSMIFSSLSDFLTLFIFYFLSKAITVGESILAYAPDYFSFVIIGIAFSSAVSTGLNTISASVRTEQSRGTFEMLLSGRITTVELLAGFLTFDTIFEIVRIIVILTLAAFFFGLKLDLSHCWVSAVFLIFTFLSFLSFGIISAGVIIITKRGDPVSFFINQANILFSGVYFPYENLPSWLRPISYLFPTTYALKGIRMNLLMGAPIGEVYRELLILVGLTLVMLPLSIAFFQAALNRSRRWGTLSTY